MAKEIYSFQSIQLLRFIAAFMVVITHATFYIATRVDENVTIWNTGAQGVQIFFVISGFVMALTSRNLITRTDGWKYFVTSRVIRIVPLYWALNLLKIIQILILPTIAFANPDIGNIIFSLLFIPSHNAEGQIETFYGVGWTLNFEMFFYLIFAVALFFRLRIFPFVGAVLLTAATLSLLRDDSWPAVTYLFHGIVLNFFWGILIAEVVFKRLKVSVALSAAMVVVGVVIIFAFPGTSLLGMQYALVVGGLIFLEGLIGPIIPKLVIFGGDASYSLYLVHPMVGVFVAILLSKLQVTSAPLGFAAIILISLLAAAATYRFFELPMTRYLKRRFLSGMKIRNFVEAARSAPLVGNEVERLAHKQLTR